MVDVMAPPGRGLVASGLRSARLGPVSFSLGPAQCMAVMGDSGAGKTVLLRLLADLDPGAGEVFLDGEARSAMPAAQWRSRVVFVPAVAGWWATDVAGHFDAGTLSAAIAMCRTLRLPTGIMDRAVLGLSTGERQRLAIVRALMVAPRVLLLDEPSSGLDPATALAMEACLHEARERGTAIVLVTHDVAQVRRMAARAYRLEGGALVVRP